MFTDNTAFGRLIRVWTDFSVPITRRRYLTHGLGLAAAKYLGDLILIYWQMFSDALIHRIHLRVLDHIKQEVESSSAASMPGLSPSRCALRRPGKPQPTSSQSE